MATRDGSFIRSNLQSKSWRIRSSPVITGHKLNGQNYVQWSQYVMMYIGGKSKGDYLTGEVVIPKKDDPNSRAGRLKITW